MLQTSVTLIAGNNKKNMARGWEGTLYKGSKHKWGYVTG